MLISCLAIEGGDYGIAMSEGVSLLCNNTTVEIVYSLSNYLTLVLMCTSPDRNVSKDSLHLNMYRPIVDSFVDDKGNNHRM